MASQISLALFGVGRWGTHLLRNFLAHPAVTVRAVVDPYEAQLQQTAQRFELPDTVALLTDWQTALDLPGLTAVAIATPAATHFDLVNAALDRNLSVLVEKPLTLSTASSAQLCDRGGQLMVDHTYLFHPAVQTGQQVLSKVGQPRYGYATRTNLGPVRFDVDALWDLAIHDIAIFNHWLGEVPQQVQAHGLGWQQPQVQQPPLFPQGLADVVWCRLRYPSGFEAVIHLCWANPDKQRRLCVVGDQGTLVFDEMAEQPLTVQSGTFDRQDGRFIPTGLAHTALVVPVAEPLAQMCDHFVQCTQQQQLSEISSGQVGTALVKVLEGLSASLHQDGQWVSLG